MTDVTADDLDEPILHSGRLTLRHWQPSEDVPAGMPDGYGPGATGLRGWSRRAIAENSGGRVVGSIGLGRDADRHIGRVEAWLAPESRGQGYATEAVRTLAGFGFARGFVRLEVRCDRRDPEAARLALRCGFGFEGVARNGLAGSGEPADAAVFARTDGDRGEPIEPTWPELSPLSDGAVVVRPLVAEDWQTVLAEATNEASVGWGFGTVMSRSQAIERCENALLDWLVGSQAQLVICDAKSGAGAGTMVLRRSGPPNVAGIGYGILPEFRGRRFTSRALVLVADWAFSRSSIARLELGCKAANVPSARSAEHAGFIREGSFAARLRNPDGSYSDEIRFARVRPPG